jgi:hypothetical protein
MVNCHATIISKVLEHGATLNTWHGCILTLAHRSRSSFWLWARALGNFCFATTEMAKRSKGRKVDSNLATR